MIEIVFKLDENKAIAYDSEKKVGECDFEEIDDIWNITHTEVDSDYQGQGIARKLVENVGQAMRYRSTIRRRATPATRTAELSRNNEPDGRRKFLRRPVFFGNKGKSNFVIESSIWNHPPEIT